MTPEFSKMRREPVDIHDAASTLLVGFGLGLLLMMILFFVFPGHNGIEGMVIVNSSLTTGMLPGIIQWYRSTIVAKIIITFFVVVMAYLWFATILALMGIGYHPIYE